jgi:hypothetical protein
VHRSRAAPRPRKWQSNPVLATRLRPSCANKPSHDTKTISRKRREAERRKAHHPWPHRRMRQRALAQRARLAALHRGACLGDRTPRLNPGRASRERRVQALPARHRPIALKRSTSRAGHSAGGDDAWTARERGDKPRPQEPHSSRQSAVTGDAPSWMI